MSRLFKFSRITLSIFLFFLVVQAHWAQAQVYLKSASVLNNKPYPLQLFDIKAQPLANALAELSAHTGHTVLAAAKHTSQLKSMPVQGFFTINKALQVMLAGTDLVAKISKNKVIVSKVKPQSSLQVPVHEAQDDIEQAAIDETALTEIVVTGQRVASIGNYASKRSNSQFSEVFSLDSLTAQPSLNLTDSLVAVPGIAISRDSGEGRHVFLRGLHSSLSQTRLNQLPALFVSDSAIDQRGGPARSRSFDFNMFTPELFAKVQVHKSYLAQLDEGGIAGTLELTSRRPFDSLDQHWHGEVQAKLHHNQALTGMTPSFSGMVSKRSPTFGVLLSADYASIDTIETGSHVWHWAQANFARHNISAQVAPNITNALVDSRGNERIFIPVGNSLSAWGNKRTRAAMNGAIQWQATPQDLLSFDLLLGTMSNDRHHYQLATAGTNGLIGEVSGLQLLVDATIQQQNLVYAELTHLDLRSEHQKQRSETNFSQISLSWQKDITELLRSQLIVGHSSSEFDSPENDKIFLQAQDNRVQLDWRNGQLQSQYGLDLRVQQHWQLMRSDVREDRFDNQFNHLKFDFSYQLSQTSQLDFGGQYKAYSSKGFERRNRRNWLTESASPQAYFQITDLPLSQPFVVAEPQQTFASIESTGLQSRNLSRSDTQVGTDYKVTENTQAFYGQYQADITWLRRQWQFNLGARYVFTEQRVQGQQQLGLTATPIEHTERYHEWLPTFNMSVELSEPWLFRFASYRNLARPDINQLRPATQVNVADLSIQLANSQLRHFTADALDMAFEYYEQGTIASVSFFYKRLNDNIIQQSINMPYRQTGLALSYLELDSRRTPDSEFTVVQSVNSGKAYVRGVEVALNTSLSKHLPNWYIISHASMNRGSTELLKNSQLFTTTPSGLSKLSYYANLYYQTDTWHAGIAATYRDSFISTVGQTQNQVEGFADSLFIDLSASYRINQAFELTASINNITDEVLHQFQDDRPLVSVQNGRVFTIGLSYSFN